jgi:hypothetical protein
VRESHGHGDEFCLQLVVLRQGNVFGLGDPIQPLVLETIFSRETGRGIAEDYIYRCIGMNEALECFPNYPHTRLSTTRSRFRLPLDNEGGEGTVNTRQDPHRREGTCVREQRRPRAEGCTGPSGTTRESSAAAEAEHCSAQIAVDWLRLDFKWIAQQISDAATPPEASTSNRETTLSVSPSQRGYRLVAKKRVLRVLRFDKA